MGCTRPEVLRPPEKRVEPRWGELMGPSLPIEGKEVDNEGSGTLSDGFRVVDQVLPPPLSGQGVAEFPVSSSHPPSGLGGGEPAPPKQEEIDGLAVVPQRSRSELGPTVAEKEAHAERLPEPADPEHKEKSRGIDVARDESPGSPRPATAVIPLVSDLSRLQQLHPLYPVWIDPVDRVLITVGEVCQTDVPLELFACSRGSKEHESIVVIAAPGYVFHAGLLALGAEAGAPVQFHPEFRPPSGSHIDIYVRWKENSGEFRESRAQDWVQDVSAMYQMFQGIVANQFEDELHPHDQWEAWKTMTYPWVFAGSQFIRDEDSGRELYLADLEGVLISVANFPSALLDVPIASPTTNAALIFRCFAERIPPIGTEVTIIFKPAGS